MRFLVVDDHALFRDGLRLTLQEAFPGAAVGEAGTLAEARAAMNSAVAFDLALIDLALPGGGWQVIETLVQVDPALPIAVISATEEYAEVVNARNRGAAAFIPKHFPRHWSVDAIRRTLEGARVFPDRSEFLFGLQRPAPPAAPAASGLALTLTPRQAQVLEGMLKGWSNKEIARALGLAEKTVKVHVSAILEATGTGNRTEAVARILAQRESGW